MEDYDVRSAASILASVKEQEARFEQLTRALEEERRNVNLQLERANLPPNPPTSQPLPWQQVVMQVNDASTLANHPPPLLVFFNHQPALSCISLPASLSKSDIHLFCSRLPSERAHPITMCVHGHCFSSFVGPPRNLSVQFPCNFDTCTHCMSPMSWMLFSNLLCGDSSLKAS